MNGCNPKYGGPTASVGVTLYTHCPDGALLLCGQAPVGACSMLGTPLVATTSEGRQLLAGVRTSAYRSSPVTALPVDAQENISRAVVPGEITSLNVLPSASADQQYRYNVDLSWDIPMDATTTGGAAITGFFLEFAELTDCESCSDTNTPCVSQRETIPWVSTGSGVAGQLGVVGAHTLPLLKGSTYIFRLQAINSVRSKPRS